MLTSYTINSSKGKRQVRTSTRNTCYGQCYSYIRLLWKVGFPKEIRKALFRIAYSLIVSNIHLIWKEQIYITCWSNEIYPDIRLHKIYPKDSSIKFYALQWLDEQSNTNVLNWCQADIKLFQHISRLCINVPKDWVIGAHRKFDIFQQFLMENWLWKNFFIINTVPYF